MPFTNNLERPIFDLSKVFALEWKMRCRHLTHSETSAMAKMRKQNRMGETATASEREKNWAACLLHYCAKWPHYQTACANSDGSFSQMPATAGNYCAAPALLHI